jgi:hypothetical protein
VATRVVPEKPKREKMPKVKADPKLVAMVREVKDRWLEQINSGAYVIEPAGKYDVTRRALPPAPAASLKSLPHAA